MEYLKYLEEVARNDVLALNEKEQNYGDSWKRRGGIGAYMVMIRKFDRLDNYMPKFNYDIFEALMEDGREESVLNDIQDARRYLMLIEAEIIARKMSSGETKD